MSQSFPVDYGEVDQDYHEDPGAAASTSASALESQRYSGVTTLPNGAAQCLECGRQFSAINNAKRHVSLVHRKDNASNQYDCHICGSAFRTVMYLRNHLRTSHGIYQKSLNSSF